MYLEVTSPVYTATKILGKKWTLEILRGLFKSSGSKHFNELRKSLNGVSPKILSQRLKEMWKFGLINRTVHTDSSPVGVSYSLTKKGWGLVQVLFSLEQWKMNFFVDI